MSDPSGWLLRWVERDIRDTPPDDESLPSRLRFLTSPALTRLDDGYTLLRANMGYGFAHKFDGAMAGLNLLRRGDLRGHGVVCQRAYRLVQVPGPWHLPEDHGQWKVTHLVTHRAHEDYLPGIRRQFWTLARSVACVMHAMGPELEAHVLLGDPPCDWTQERLRAWALENLG